MFWKKKSRQRAEVGDAQTVSELSAGAIPKHIAIILDGNGRWAKAQGRPRWYGHQEGMKNVSHVAGLASKLGVEAMTLYAFSTENWKRKAAEVDFLMKLPIRFFDEFTPIIMDLDIRMEIIGHKEELPEKLQEKIEEIELLTLNNKGMRLLIALNYGSQRELTQMVQTVAGRVKNGEVTPSEITPALIEDHLFTRGLPPVDLLIRTSGEQRISNFLLWQIAYAELYFTDTPWPDFKEEALYKAVAAYQNRDRRFGGIKETE